MNTKTKKSVISSLSLLGLALAPTERGNAMLNRLSTIELSKGEPVSAEVSPSQDPQNNESHFYSQLNAFIEDRRVQNLNFSIRKTYDESQKLLVAYPELSKQLAQDPQNESSSSATQEDLDIRALFLSQQDQIIGEMKELEAIILSEYPLLLDRLPGHQRSLGHEDKLACGIGVVCAAVLATVVHNVAALTSTAAIAVAVVVVLAVGKSGQETDLGVQRL